MVLNAVPARSWALRLKIVSKILDRLQLKVVLSVCSGYRTISTEAAFLEAGVPPMELLARVRTKVYNGVRKEEARTKLMRRRQERWGSADKGEWTRRIIPLLHRWFLYGHGHTNYHVTQFFKWTWELPQLPTQDRQNTN
ncbi:uncharacterized protein LOC124356023 [Homalodisca vitripennis]|uniref:uncharacterized protein LOC124356023 n=1 Tax=Homalodisca vitripennis TaxID=197043 RepID=UPI001EEB1A32|nr:uncharacterized protein LOC124356023 [Homalodisca vitripennis]